MYKPFSQRNQPVPSVLTYEFPMKARNRLIHNLAEAVNRTHGNFNNMLRSAGRQAVLRYGQLSQDSDDNRVRVYSRDRHVQDVRDAQEHYAHCSDEEVVDFLEFCFWSDEYSGGQLGVNIINEVMREEGIGYEFSPYVVQLRVVRQLPQATKKTNDLVHTEVVMPTLELLSGADWKGANAHMLKAHEYYRKGEYRPAITECGSSLETALKTICTKKGWTYAPNQDVLSTLIRVCKDGNLFYGFYAPGFEASGTIRNKLGAHGQEPQKHEFVAEAHHAEHMIHLVSSHILFLAKCAGMR